MISYELGSNRQRREKDEWSHCLRKNSMVSGTQLPEQNTLSECLHKIPSLIKCPLLITGFLVALLTWDSWQKPRSWQDAEAYICMCQAVQDLFCIFTDVFATIKYTMSYFIIQVWLKKKKKRENGREWWESFLTYMEKGNGKVLIEQC